MFHRRLELHLILPLWAGSIATLNASANAGIFTEVHAYIGSDLGQFNLTLAAYLIAAGEHTYFVSAPIELGYWFSECPLSTPIFDHCVACVRALATLGTRASRGSSPTGSTTNRSGRPTVRQLRMGLCGAARLPRGPRVCALILAAHRRPVNPIKSARGLSLPRLRALPCSLRTRPCGSTTSAAPRGAAPRGTRPRRPCTRPSQACTWNTTCRCVCARESEPRVPGHFPGAVL